MQALTEKETSIISPAFKLVKVVKEEEEKLRREFPEVQIEFDTDSFPFRIVVVYDFLKLDKEERYRFFDFERRLLDRMEEVLSEFFGEKVSLPVEVEFLRKSPEYGK